jgi:hypothetical protein
MNGSRFRKRVFGAALIGLIAGGVGMTVPASAQSTTDPTAVQTDARAHDIALASSTGMPLAQRVAAQLRITPGGVQVSPNEISWQDGAVVMVFPVDGASKAPATSGPRSGPP